jgi:hypothetical protein
MARTKPLDFEARIEALHAKGASAGYAVAQYHKVKEVDGEYVERLYVIRLNGSMVTRQVICDLRRSFDSFHGDGWHAHETPTIPFKNIRSYCKRVDEQLTKLGYERQF